MKPPSKKRTVSESPSIRPRKHRRTAFVRPDGQTSSPSQSEGLLSRWTSSLSNLYDVSRDTALLFFRRNLDDMPRQKINGHPQDTSETTSDATLVERPELKELYSRSSTASIRGQLYPSNEPPSGRYNLHKSKLLTPTPIARLASEPLSTTMTPTVLTKPGTSNGSAISRSQQSASSLRSSSSPATSSQLKLGSYQNFRPMSPSSSDLNQRDTPMRRPRRKRKGSMGPPSIPFLRNTEPFPSGSSSMEPSPQPATTFVSRPPSRSSSIHSMKTPRTESRKHILAAQHKAKVEADFEADRKAITQELYEMHKKRGYRSDLKEFEGLLEYRALLEASESPNEPTRGRVLTSSTSIADLRSAKPIQPTRQRRYSDIYPTPDYLRRALDIARATLAGPKPAIPFSPTLEQRRLRDRAKDEDIERRLRPKRQPLPSLLPEADELSVNVLLRKSGVVSKLNREQVSGQDIQRLRPGQWLNDEIINFYGAMLMGRSQSGKENKGNATFLNVHYFSTFFWSKLDRDGYEKGRMAKWTKKFDIFSKDVILIPVNHNNMHWTGAAINFRKKRIESYDSMNMPRQNVFKQLRQYLAEEHKNKKKKTFDFTGWTDHTLEETPQQENGYDCGVFTCQFLHALSRGDETFNFTQKDIPYLRRRMIWEIGHARLRDDT